MSNIATQLILLSIIM